MIYKKYNAQKSLTNYVECYFTWEGKCQEPMSVETPPNAFCSIVFNYGDPYTVSNYKYDLLSVPSAFLSGQSIRHYTLNLKGKISMAGVVLKPATLFHLLGTPMYNYTEERVDIMEAMPKSCHPYISNISKSKTHKDRILHIRQLINHLFDSGGFGTPEIQFAANAILDHKGIINIPELIEASYMSRRKFERKFLEEVGVSPKAYAKIRRFGYTCSLMAGKRTVNLTELLYQGGYYDQSHFIKDFKYFANRTPRFYVENNQELANFLEAREFIEL